MIIALIGCVTYMSKMERGDYIFTVMIALSRIRQVLLYNSIAVIVTFYKKVKIKNITVLAQLY